METPMAELPITPLDSVQQMRELADQLLRSEFEGRLNAAWITGLPDASLLVREDGTIHRANLQATIVFGARTSEELLGKNVRELVPPAARAVHDAHVAGYVAKPATRLMALGRRLRACRLDGSEFDADIALAPLWGEIGLLTIVVIRDVTSRQYYAEGTRAP